MRPFVFRPAAAFCNAQFHLIRRTRNLQYQRPRANGMKAKQLIILSFLLSFLLSILVLAASGSARAEEPAKNPAVHLWVD